MSCCDDEMKRTVKESYGKIWEKEGACCESSCEPSKTVSISLQTAHEELLKEIMPFEGKRILDVGCGTGDTVLELAKRVGSNGKAVGIDLSHEGITKAKQKAADYGLEEVTEFRIADAERLPFQGNYFDVVISECVVCLAPDKRKALKEKTRVLKPGGKIAMHDVVSRTSMPEIVQTNPELYCGCIGGAVAQEDYVEMLKQAGLTEIKAADYSDRPAMSGYPISIKKALDSQILMVATGIKEEKGFQEMVNFVRKGGVGYMLFTAKKPLRSKS